MGAPGAGAPLCFLIVTYIARLNFIHADHTALAYRSVEPPFTKPSSYAPGQEKIFDFDLMLTYLWPYKRYYFEKYFWHRNSLLFLETALYSQIWHRMKLLVC